MKQLITILALVGSTLILPGQDLIDSTSITATASDEFGAAFPASNTLDGQTLEGFNNVGDARTSSPPSQPSKQPLDHSRQYPDRYQLPSTSVAPMISLN